MKYPKAELITSIQRLLLVNQQYKTNEPISLEDIAGRISMDKEITKYTLDFLCKIGLFQKIKDTYKIPEEVI